MRADRMLSLVELLRQHGRMSAAELARRLEVTPRTVMRDIDVLSGMGVPVYAERGRRGGYALLPGYRPPPEQFTADESQALMLGAASVADALGLGDSFARAARRLASGMPESHSRHVGHLLQRVLIEPSGWSDTVRHPDALAPLFDAVQRDRQVHVDYHALSSGRGGIRTLNPWGLVLADTTWYLIATSATRRARTSSTRAASARGRSTRGPASPHAYRLSRFASIEVLDTEVQRPARVDLHQTWQDLRTAWNNRAAQPVRLRVRRQEVDLVIRSLQIATGGQPAMVLPDDPDGSAERPVVSAQVTTLRGVVGVLLGFGTWVEILEPAELRAMFVDVATEVIDLYAARSPFAR